ncbi:putative ATP-dependent helicase Lhr [Thiorhodovibrio winogradskyi]|uniref:ATP-dependent helicase Lhr n=1 Tax=Thiorhodovibrio winogradskyi TaxID=77007 RepID=A0ABZ0S9K8_9GAMM|nr:DEAD/DEAH box helicase [Thiorhodovibrio winogradskyi]
MSAHAAFSPATRAWFEANFSQATPVQQQGWPAIAAGQHALLVAPTGSGKTLAAFLSGIDACLRLPADAPAGVRVLYISPLKALVHDVERNLRAPLAGIAHQAEGLAEAVRPIQIAMRTGDTPQRERHRQAKSPAEILVTTPESLFLLLGSQARETLRWVHTLIIDEIHALAPTKRGAHLALSLERLAALCEQDPQRIGLSATVNPLAEVARFLGGRRAVELVDCSAPPRLDLQVRVPVPDMEQAAAAQAKPAGAKAGGPILAELYTRELASPKPAERGIWPVIYPALLASIQRNRATLIFVNSRGLCERLTQRLNELAGEELVQSHHGSVSHQKRAEIEERLKLGQLRGIVATSSLELGIDMGSIDRVLLVESPGSVARGLQRVGRAGHQVGEVSVGRIFPKFRGDLLEATVIAQRMRAGQIEPLSVPRNALDVLAQQIVAICCDQPRTSTALLQLVSAAYPYQSLSMSLLQPVLEMLSGHYPAQDFAELRPLLAWDRASDSLRPRRGAALLARLNAGTIPDRGQYPVMLASTNGASSGPSGQATLGRLGELDEEMVFETRVGDNILLGASTWRVEDITRDRVLVSPAPGEPGKLPFWRGDGPGRPIELGRALGAMVRELGAMTEEAAHNWLRDQAGLDTHAAHNLIDYIAEQRAHTATLPTDRAITIERFRDELGDWRLCILSPWGARVHAPWAMAIQQRLSSQSGFNVQVMYTDDGIVLRFADIDELPGLDLLLPDPDELEDLVTAQLAHTALFASLFRENAARALLLPRRRAGGRSPLWAQRLKAQHLLAAVRRFPSFPMVLETYRQALNDIFDLGALARLLGDIGARRVRVHEVETHSASPFARSLVFAYVAAYIYEQDAPLAERRAQALTLDRQLLAELLGQAELRELIDPAVIAEVEAQLQYLQPERQARDADELHDLLRRLGDLTEDELQARAALPTPEGQADTLLAGLDQLRRERRAVAIRLAGESRWIAAEDAGLYRDALGCLPPPGLPAAYLEAPPRPLESLLQRYARTHGPFLTAEPAARLALRPAQIEPALRLLAEAGTLVQGEIRPGGSAPEWCDAEVLRRLKRGTLARLRDQVAPVESAALARFLLDWHGIGSKRGGLPRLLEIIGQLQGLELPWSAWQGDILPRRMQGFNAEMLDLLAATGQVVWVGRGALGSRDGRVALYLREQAPELLPPAEEPEALEPAQQAILEHLKTRGASFLFELESAVRRTLPALGTQDFRDALWDLVWAGHISNDTFAPLRALGSRAPKAIRGRVGGSSTLAGGRWTLVASLCDAKISPTERTLAHTQQLLERHGLVSREMATADTSAGQRPGTIPGSFSPIYRILRDMEAAGQVRRGYFIEGLSGAQFARAAVVERLRQTLHDDDSLLSGKAPPSIIALPAIDPANPWGNLLSWPDTSNPAAARPKRSAGAWLLLHLGHPVLYLAPGGRSLLTFPEPLRDPGIQQAAFQALRQLPRSGQRRSLTIEKIDGIAAERTPWREALQQCGFEFDYRGFCAKAAKSAAGSGGAAINPW